MSFVIKKVKMEPDPVLSGSYRYKGLTFPRYCGDLTRDEERSGHAYFAFFGDRHLTTMSIRYLVDQIEMSGQRLTCAA